MKRVGISMVVRVSLNSVSLLEGEDKEKEGKRGKGRETDASSSS